MAMCVVLYASRLRMRLTEQNMVWRSRVAGRARTIGNRVYPKRVSRVQIPPSPPKPILLDGLFCLDLPLDKCDPLDIIGNGKAVL